MMNSMMGNGQGFMMNNNNNMNNNNMNNNNMNNNNMMMNQMMMNNNMNNTQFNNNMMNNFNMNNMVNFMNNNMNNNMNFNMNNLNPMALQSMYNFMLMMNPNINVNNPMNVNNNLMNFIMANPLFFQYFMNQSNVNNNMNNNNNNNNNNNSFNFFKGDISKAKIGILPRPDANNNKSKSFLICPNNQGQRSNIMFITGAGLKTVVIAPTNLPVNELFKEYIRKMGQDPRVLGKYIYFLYNGVKIDLNEPKTINQYGLNSSSVIMVVDTSNLLGGFF